jgi:hypothetical protein
MYIGRMDYSILSCGTRDLYDRRLVSHELINVGYTERPSGIFVLGIRVEQPIGNQ